MHANLETAARRDGYLHAIERIQSHGITVNGCFILGLDSHTPDIFQTCSISCALRLFDVQITVLTPFPGTPLYHRLRRKGGCSERFWDLCTLFDVNYRPKRMTVDELKSGLRWLFGAIYSAREFIGRKRRDMEIVKARM